MKHITNEQFEILIDKIYKIEYDKFNERQNLKNLNKNSWFYKHVKFLNDKDRHLLAMMTAHQKCEDVKHWSVHTILNHYGITIDELNKQK